jgi:hypothetical protein
MSKLYVDEIASKTGATDAMTIDTSGRILQPTKPSFFATNNATAWQSFGNTNFNTMPFNTTSHNIGNHYDTSNYRFNVPVTGSYYFYMQFLHDGTSTTSYGQARFLRTDTSSGVHVLNFSHNSVQGDMVATATVAYLQANDYVEAQGQVGNTNADDWYALSYFSNFCGYFIG